MCVLSIRLTESKFALCFAVEYTSYLPCGSEPPKQAVRVCFLWIVTLLRLLVSQQDTLADQNKQALIKHKEHSRLVKLAANMSDDDYEHAGVDKLEDKIAAARQLRRSLETTITWVKAEIGVYTLLDPGFAFASGTSLLCAACLTNLLNMTMTFQLLP